jgi:alkylated DNA repair protein (DNA oxidative demethylase)
MMLDLFESRDEVDSAPQPLGPGAMVLRGLAAPQGAALLAAVERVVERAPLRFMTTPGGYRMSVAMSNCGAAGWVTDRSGYRYDAIDPLTGHRWPAMPSVFTELACEAAATAGFSDFSADACLMPLLHGDVVVWGGAARLNFHGVLPLKEGQHSLLGSCRLNLTFRKAL